jgi:hypothetical protein
MVEWRDLESAKKKRVDSHDSSSLQSSQPTKLEIWNSHNGETVIHGFLPVEVTSFEDVLCVWKQCLSKRKARLSEQGFHRAQIQQPCHWYFEGDFDQYFPGSWNYYRKDPICRSCVFGRYSKFWIKKGVDARGNTSCLWLQPRMEMCQQIPDDFEWSSQCQISIPMIRPIPKFNSRSLAQRQLGIRYKWWVECRRRRRLLATGFLASTRKLERTYRSFVSAENKYKTSNYNKLIVYETVIIAHRKY